MSRLVSQTQVFSAAGVIGGREEQGPGADTRKDQEEDVSHIVSRAWVSNIRELRVRTGLSLETNVSSHNTSLQNGGLSGIFVEWRICSKQPEYETKDSVTKSRENGSVSIKYFLLYDLVIYAMEWVLIDVQS